MTFENCAIAVSITLNNKRMEIINVDAPHKKETKDALLNLKILPSCLLAGDFNAHHTNWYGALAPDKSNIIRASKPSAEFLVEWTDRHGLLLLNTPGTLTHFPRNGSGPSIPDCTFASKDLYSAVANWTADAIDNGDSDHAKLTTTLHVAQPIFQPKRQHHRTDWNLFLAEFNKLDAEGDSPNSIEKAELAAEDLNNCFAKAMEKSIPWSKPGQGSNIWWTKEISELKSKLHAGKGRAKQDASDESFKAHQKEEART